MLFQGILKEGAGSGKCPFLGGMISLGDWNIGLRDTSLGTAASTFDGWLTKNALSRHFDTSLGTAASTFDGWLTKNALSRGSVAENCSFLGSS